jgi:hypothetical protein
LRASRWARPRSAQGTRCGGACAASRASEIDGHRAPEGGNGFEIALHDAKATLVSFGAPGHGIAAPRRRRLIADSRRTLARDDRGAHLAAEAEPPR